MQQIIVLVINVIIPEAMRIMQQYNIRVPYQTSILRGKDWVDELLNGHPNGSAHVLEWISMFLRLL
jgi:hypothetical protein